jgi:chromosomal replication initiation ATPase DnaA
MQSQNITLHIHDKQLQGITVTFDNNKPVTITPNELQALASHKRRMAPIIHNPNYFIDREGIIAIVCKHFNVTFEQLRKKDKHRKIHYPRMMLIYLLINLLKTSLTEVGNLLNRDHSTIINARNQMLNDILNYNEVSTEYELLLATCQNTLQS